MWDESSFSIKLKNDFFHCSFSKSPIWLFDAWFLSIKYLNIIHAFKCHYQFDGYLICQKVDMRKYGFWLKLSSTWLTNGMRLLLSQQIFSKTKNYSKWLPFICGFSFSIAICHTICRPLATHTYICLLLSSLCRLKLITCRFFDINTRGKEKKTSEAKQGISYLFGGKFWHCAIAISAMTVPSCRT